MPKVLAFLSVSVAGSSVLKEPAGNPLSVAEAASAGTEVVEDEVVDDDNDVVVVVVVIVDDDVAAGEVVASGSVASPVLVGFATLDGTLLGPEVSVPAVVLAEPGRFVSRQLGFAPNVGVSHLMTL